MRWKMPSRSVDACAIETPGLSRASMNQCSGNPAKPIDIPGCGVLGIHKSASYQPKRGGMIPTRVRAVPFSAKVLFNTAGSPLNCLFHALYRSTNTGGAPGLCRVGFSKINAEDYYWYMTFDARAGEVSSESEMRTHVETLFRTYFPQWIGVLHNTRTQDILRTDISDLKPLTQWSSGRIGLIGDAAHATTPNLGQGGAMAVEDALPLAIAFKNLGLNEEAWKRFEHLRRKKVDWTVATSWSIGRVCHLGNPLFRSLRNIALNKMPASVTQKQIQRIRKTHAARKALAL